MQACEGYVENGRFFPIGVVAQIPGRRRAFLTILDEPAQQSNTVDKAFWVEFDRMTAESADENELLHDEAFARRTSGREFIVFEEEGQAL